MLLKLLCCIMVVCHCGMAADDLVEVLGGARGGNRVAVCLLPGADVSAERRPCPGAVWRSRWVLARASCIRRGLLHMTVVVRDSVDFNCEDFSGVRQWHQICVKFNHPEYERSARGDLALLGIKPPFPELDVLANTSTVHQLLSEFEPWMEDVYKQYPMEPHKVSYRHTCSLLSTPFRLFCTTILLPCVLVMVVFIFVIFYTGSKEQIPYKSIEYEQYDKKSENIEDMSEETKSEDNLVEV